MNICMLSYSFYESDTRVMAYAEALVERGDHVDVLALNTGNQAVEEVIRGVRVHRIQQRAYNENGKLDYLKRVLRFVFVSGLYLAKMHLKKKYALVHVHSVPDFEIVAALITRLSGGHIILDIHDLVPELYASKFGLSDRALLYKGLVVIEKICAALSDHVIAANHLWEARLVSRSVPEAKCSTFLNYPNSGIFYERPRTRKDDKIIMIYPGTVSYHQGLDLAVKAFAPVADQEPSVEFHIYGDGPQKEEIEELVLRLNLQDRVVLRGFMPVDKMASIVSQADIGVVPKRGTGFGAEAFSTKILEFMALGVPAIVPRTKIDLFYFNEGVVNFFSPEDTDDLSRAMLDLVRNPGRRAALSNAAREFVREYSWEKRKGEYLSLVDRLVKS